MFLAVAELLVPIFFDREKETDPAGAGGLGYFTPVELLLSVYQNVSAQSCTFRAGKTHSQKKNLIDNLKAK